MKDSTEILEELFDKKVLLPMTLKLPINITFL